MAHYTARVQLPGSPTAAQYERLHQAMRTLNLFTVSSAISGRHYILPHGLYAGLSLLTADQLASEAKAAADAIVRDAEVVVTAGPMTMSGLKSFAAQKAG